ncbi:uncharacterized protein LOC108096716 [Drosophila ficusphila]|uniref:uncharacterized protein LOC108096716 n=1 Tax=Drosophila ficusphila TaxID=30025 RepID=UPI0007E724D6|nr:uncharacterized protein LOC108096716 [Drosophila ficusphila]
MTDASANSLDVSVDVVWPTIIVLTMLVINGFVFAYIMRKRREYKGQEDQEQLPVPQTSYAATSQVATAHAVPEDDSCAIEMERL